MHVITPPYLTDPGWHLLGAHAQGLTLMDTDAIYTGAVGSHWRRPWSRCWRVRGGRGHLSVERRWTATPPAVSSPIFEDDPLWATAAQQVGWCYQIISLHSTRSLVDVAVWSLCRFCFVEIKTELGFQKSRKLGSLWSIFIIKLSLIYEMTKNFMSAQDTVYQVIIVTLLHIYGWMFPWRSYSD